MTIPKSLLKVQGLYLTEEEYFCVVNPASDKTRHEEILQRDKSYLPSDNAPSYRKAVLKYRRKNKKAAIAGAIVEW